MNDVDDDDGAHGLGVWVWILGALLGAIIWVIVGLWQAVRGWPWF